MRSGALPIERIRGVQTGGCPHTAIREDTSINHEALDEMRAKFPDVEILFLESGGDNLAASFSPELVDVSIYVIDVAGGDKVPRKGGPGVTRSDLLVINKIDLAPNVGADLSRDGARCGGRPRRQASHLHEPQTRRGPRTTSSNGFVARCSSRPRDRCRTARSRRAPRSSLELVFRAGSRRHCHWRSRGCPHR